MKEGRKQEYVEKTPDDELQKMPHTKAQNSSSKQDLILHNSIGGRLGSRHANRYTIITPN